MIAASWLAEITQRLAARGFNLVGVADARLFDAGAPAGRRLAALFPAARSAVVIACGGRAVWEAATGAHGTIPGCSLPSPGDPDPIDTFTGMTVSEEAARFAAAFPEARLRVVYPFGEQAATFSFTRLAEEAGLGTADTVLRLLLHPRYGPWVSLRACLLTDLDLPAGGRLESFRPCEECPRPCLNVCPAGVLTAGGWDHAACFAYRRAGPNCLDGCAPRLACPVGAEHRHGPAEMRHRQLAAMREA
jgi:hypothetical protein